MVLVISRKLWFQVMQACYMLLFWVAYFCSVTLWVGGLGGWGFGRSDTLMLSVPQSVWRCPLRLRAWFFRCSTLLQLERCFLPPYRCTYNAFFMDLLRPSFVYHHSSLFTTKSSYKFCGRHVMASIKSSVIFIVATLITKVLFKQLLIRIAAQRPGLN